MSGHQNELLEHSPRQLEPLSSPELVEESSSQPFRESPTSTPPLLRQRISSIFGRSPHGGAKAQRASFALANDDLNDIKNSQKGRRISLLRNGKRFSLDSNPPIINGNSSNNNNNYYYYNDNNDDEYDDESVLMSEFNINTSYESKKRNVEMNVGAKSTVGSDSPRAFRPLRNFTEKPFAGAYKSNSGKNTFTKRAHEHKETSKRNVHEGRKRVSEIPNVRVVTSFRGNVIPEYRGPLPRVGHTAVMYDRNMYIFGGVNHKGNYLSHIFRHERRSFQWEELHSVGVIPCGRANHSAIVTEHHMYIYGGHRELDVFDDLFSFDFRSNRWDKIPFDKSQSPGPVFLHTGVYIPVTQSMAVIGGFHQREHNTHIGHIFDIRNRVWSGILSPPSVDPHHLQLVTAAFFAPQDVIIVIGIIRDEESALPVALDSTIESEISSRMLEINNNTAIIHLLNVHTQIWTEVRTTASPESPLPFRLCYVWELFLNTFVRMGGYYDDRQCSWYFPLNLHELGNEAFYSVSTSVDHVSHESLSVSNVAPQRRKYGFFTLRLVDMTWSILPISFPKKIITENSYRTGNQNIHSKKGSTFNTRFTNNNKITTSSAATTRFSSPFSPSSPQPLLTVEANTISVNRHDSTSSNNNTQLTSTKRKSSDSTKTQNFTSSHSGRLRTQEEEAEFIKREQQEQRRYSWKNEGIMMRRNTNDMRRLRRRPSNSLLRTRASIMSSNSKSIITPMSGPLTPQRTYPVVQQAINVSLDELTPRKTSLTTSRYNPRWRDELNSYNKRSDKLTSGQGPYDLLYSVHGHPQFEHKYVYAMYREVNSRGLKSGMQYLIMHGGLEPAEHDYTMLMFTPVITRVDALATQKLTDPVNIPSTRSESSAEIQTMSTSMTNRQASKSFNNYALDIYSAFGDSYTNAFTDPSNTPESLAIQQERCNTSALLPTLPCNRSEKNIHRFAILFHANNSVHNTDLLPYQSTPVAVLENEAEILKWSHNYYKDSRFWIAAQLKSAITEDKQARRRLRQRLREQLHEEAYEESYVSSEEYRPEKQQQQQQQQRERQRQRKGANNNNNNKNSNNAMTANNQHKRTTRQGLSLRQSSPLSTSKKNKMKGQVRYARVNRTDGDGEKWEETTARNIKRKANKANIHNETRRKKYRNNKNNNTINEEEQNVNEMGKEKVSKSRKEKEHKQESIFAHGRKRHTDKRATESKRLLQNYTKHTDSHAQVKKRHERRNTSSPSNKMLAQNEEPTSSLSSVASSRASKEEEEIDNYHKKNSTSFKSYSQQRDLYDDESHFMLSRTVSLSSSHSSSSSSSSSLSSLSSSSSSKMRIPPFKKQRLLLSSSRSSSSSFSTSFNSASSSTVLELMSPALARKAKMMGWAAEEVKAQLRRTTRKKHALQRKKRHDDINGHKKKKSATNDSEEDEEEDAFFNNDMWAIEGKARTNNKESKNRNNKYYRARENNGECGNDMHDESVISNTETNFFARRKLNCFDLISFESNSTSIFFPQLWNSYNTATGVVSNDVSNANDRDAGNEYDMYDENDNNDNETHFLNPLHLPGLERLSIPVKRHMELQRLPAHIFERGANNEINVSNLGSAMSYVLLHNALAALPNLSDPLVRAERARRRWNFLRALVCTGEAAFILYRASQEASKMSGIPVSSTPGLMMAPELNLVGPTRSYKIVTRPVPYNLPHTTLPILPTQRTEVSTSGMVGYGILRDYVEKYELNC